MKPVSIPTAMLTYLILSLLAASAENAPYLLVSGETASRKALGRCLEALSIG